MGACPDDQKKDLLARGCICTLVYNDEKGRYQPDVRLPGCPVHVNVTAAMKSMGS